MIQVGSRVFRYDRMNETGTVTAIEEVPSTANVDGVGPLSNARIAIVELDDGRLMRISVDKLMREM